MKSEVFNIRVSKEMKERIQKKAESENRTMSNYLETLIKDSFNKENIIEMPISKRLVKDAIIILRVSPEFKSELKEKANKENRTMSNYIMTVLQSSFSENLN